jgi:hypothetical protein
MTGARRQGPPASVSLPALTCAAARAASGKGTMRRQLFQKVRGKRGANRIQNHICGRNQGFPGIRLPFVGSLSFSGLRRRLIIFRLSILEDCRAVRKHQFGGAKHVFFTHVGSSVQRRQRARRTPGKKWRTQAADPKTRGQKSHPVARLG